MFKTMLTLNIANNNIKTLARARHKKNRTYCGHVPFGGLSSCYVSEYSAYLKNYFFSFFCGQQVDTFHILRIYLQKVGFICNTSNISYEVYTLAETK